MTSRLLGKKVIIRTKIHNCDCHY